MAKSKKTNVVPANQKYTLMDFNADFPNDDACLMYIFFARWPDGSTICDSEKCATWNGDITA